MYHIIFQIKIYLYKINYIIKGKIHRRGCTKGISTRNLSL